MIKNLSPKELLNYPLELIDYEDLVKLDYNWKKEYAQKHNFKKDFVFVATALKRERELEKLGNLNFTSIATIQKELKCGFARAGRLYDFMIKTGVIDGKNYMPGKRAILDLTIYNDIINKGGN